MDKKQQKRNYGKGTKVVSGIVDNFENYSTMLFPVFLVLTIALAPFGFIGGFFSYLFLANLIVFFLSSSSWKDEFKKASENIIDAEKMHKEEMTFLKEQIKSLEEEHKSLQKKIRTEEEMSEIKKKFTTLKKMQNNREQALSLDTENNNQKEKKLDEDLKNIKEINIIQ